MQQGMVTMVLMQKAMMNMMGLLLYLKRFFQMDSWFLRELMLAVDSDRSSDSPNLPRVAQ